MLTDPLNKEESGALIMHAIASILIGRPAQGLKDLANPVIGNSHDSQLWKALAYARQGKWADAREKFKNVEFAIASLPLDIQRIVTMEAMRASLEVKDYAGASKRRSEIEVVGISPEAAPGFAVLRGRLAEALGHDKDALDDYKFAVASNDRQAAAEAKQLEVALRQKRDEISKEDALRELETLSMTWRGDSIEVKTLQMLSQMYAENGRYRDALRAARTATRLQPNAEASRQAQDLASDLFTQIFLGPKGDELPPVEALGMFYEFRELTPIGRRGDELIRRLADRLASIDLLDQAAELLQYQVDHRLEGAARAQVAARLSMIYLANRKPDMAISALRASRISDLSGELRQQRLLLEARAQSDVGRHDLALDIVSNVSGREVLRLRSDIFWAARRWRESAEQIELYYGDRFRDFKPLNAVEKSDIIRAAVGYALADDLDRPVALPREIRAADERERGPARLRHREQAGRGLQRRIRRDRQARCQRRHARRLPARDEAALPRRHRPRAGLAASQGRGRPHRLAAHDPRRAADQDDAVGTLLPRGLSTGAR